MRLTLLQNATTISLQKATEVYYKMRPLITKCDSYYKLLRFCYKMRLTLLQNATTISLQKATEVYYKMRPLITKCDSYYKLLRFCYKMRHLLQNALVQRL